MKCNNCGKEWAQLPSDSNITCPCCKVPVFTLSEEIDSQLIEKMLHQITSLLGTDTLIDGQKTIAAFSDLAPKSKREIVLLSCLVKSGGNKKLMAARNKEVGEQQLAFGEVYRSLVTEHFLNEQAAKQICILFSNAIGFKLNSFNQYKSQDSLLQNRLLNTTNGKPKNGSLCAEPHNRGMDITVYSPQKKKASIKSIGTWSFQEYIEELEKLFVSKGKMPLSSDQIEGFICKYGLDKKWSIMQSDVEKDLNEIYFKYKVDSADYANLPHNAFEEPIKLSFSSHKRISSYEDYLNELKQLYIQNGHMVLSSDQIDDFIREFDLQHEYGITAADVKNDLLCILQPHN